MFTAPFFIGLDRIRLDWLFEDMLWLYDCIYSLDGLSTMILEFKQSKTHNGMIATTRMRGNAADMGARSMVETRVLFFRRLWTAEVLHL